MSDFRHAIQKSSDPLEQPSQLNHRLQRTGTRTPRPYLFDGGEIQQDGRPSVNREQGEIHNELQSWSGEPRSGLVSPPAGSESGTEADDERPAFVKTLPPPQLRPRKGLVTGEISEDVLFTPSQLDDLGARLGGDYFSDANRAMGPRASTTQAEDEREELERMLARRRLAEFARRSSEVALVFVVALVVLSGGRGVLATTIQWWRELAVHTLTVGVLVLVYPVKLSIVDSHTRRSKFWQRFRVPASFDPATVLYPPFLPVLVAFTVSPSNSAVILPNLILGLASLPQRLFLRSSRLFGFNSVHWFISLLPVMVTQYHPSFRIVSSNALPPETLVSLYALHHTLLHPLQYLTTTSLLMSELHLLSVALINLLIFASSPQTYILQALLWIGAIMIFTCCASVLRWNVTLARVPKWKLRRPGSTAEERRSLVDAVTELINLQRATGTFQSSKINNDSDADEDGEAIPSDQPHPLQRASTLRLDTRRRGSQQLLHPNSAIEPPKTLMNGHIIPDNSRIRRPRSNTLPTSETALIHRRASSGRRRRTKKSSLLWCLHLTPDQARRRKLVYAFWVYSAILVIIFVVIRRYVAGEALANHDPFGWAIGYLFGQISPISQLVDTIGIADWTQLPPDNTDIGGVWSALPTTAVVIRAMLGAANTRLLIIAYWAVVLTLGLLVVFSLTAYVEVDTRRKVFHGVMVAMLLPATFVDPCFCALALTLALAIFLLLEVIRAGQVPPLGNAIGRFVAPYVDGRDLRGPVVVSHIFLLIGCAVPLWFSLAGLERSTYPGSPWKDWEIANEQREVAMIAGVVCVGMGDAAASLVGRRYGRHKWLWVGGKSIEGSAAFAAAVIFGLTAAKVWLVYGGWIDAAAGGAVVDLLNPTTLFIFLVKTVFCACSASFMEAVLTGANDNVVVPIVLWLLVKGTRL